VLGVATEIPDHILRKDDTCAGVSLREGCANDTRHKIAMHDGAKRAEKTVSLLKGASQNFPPERKVPADVK
jgi:hypothetical protein